MKMNTSTPKTPFPRLLAGISIGSFGQTLASIVPIALLITIKLAMLDPEHITRNFSIIGLISGIVGMLGQYVAGYVSDRTSWKLGRRRPWILIGAVTGSLLLYGIGTATTATTVFVFWGLANLMFNFVSCATTALIPDQIPENKRGTASGVIGIISPLGIMIGVNIMLLLNNWSIENKFLLLGVICIVCSLISCVLIKEDRVVYNKVNTKPEEITLSHRLSRIYPSPKKYPYFTYGVLTRFFMAIAYSASAFTSVYFTERFHVSPEDLTGIVAMSMNISVPLLGVSSILGGLISDKVGRQKPFVMVAAIIAAIGIVGYSFAPSIAFTYVCGAILSLGFGMFLAVDIALMARLLPHPEDAAKDMGIVNIANALGSPIASSLANPIIAFGGYPLFFGALAVFGILSGLAVIPIPENEKKIDSDLKIAQ